MAWLSQWCRRLKQAVGGQNCCALCHAPSGVQAVCAACSADVDTLRLDAGRHCPLCGVPSAWGTPCGACQRKPPPQQYLRASFRYAPPLSHLLYAYKFLGQNHLYAVLAEWMLADIPAWPEGAAPDAVLAVPLSRQRLHRRGFNQSALLAAAVAGHLQLPLLPPSVLRRQHRAAQSTLPKALRRRNVRGVFQVADPGAVKGRKLLLIDDVVTTGATLAELSQTLMRAGAAAVYCWVLARPD
ncbi:MAG: ComF family protein [Eikenella sp.]|nr:ComF family protein [Eikenella sp.]